MSTSASTITIRLAGCADRNAVAGLAALDSAEPPAWPVLLGEVDGELRAALSLADGAEVADPFFLSQHLLALLRAHSATNAEPTRRHARFPAGGVLRLGRRWAILRSA